MQSSRHNSRRLSLLSKLAITASAAACLLPSVLYAADPAFVNWVNDFKKEAVAEGISVHMLDKGFYGVSMNERVIELDRRQPEGTMSFEKYLERVVNTRRIREGRRLLAEHYDLLQKMNSKYEVQPHYIVALWGIETNFGSNTGGFSVVEALATLAYEGRRAEFFRKELMNAFKIMDAGHIKPDNMKGSWAGAMGQCQFMPSSFLAFAQDGNGDGKKDIWNNLDDVFASIANYLHKSGWDREFTWGREVMVPEGFDKSLASTKETKSLKEWQKLGVRQITTQDLPDIDAQASLVFPDDDVQKRAYLVYGNYKTILKWNRSLYFATAVGILADKLK